MDIGSLQAALLIAGLRIIDVCLGVVRTVYAVEGRRFLSAALGFLEAGTFIAAAGIVFSGTMTPLKMLGYASGFATGTALGVTVVRRLNLGSVAVRIVSPHGPIGVAEALHDAGFDVSVFDGKGKAGPIRLILAVVAKRDLERLLGVARPWLDQCFVTVGEEPLRITSYPPATGIRK